MNPTKHRQFIQERATGLGFDQVGFTSPDRIAGAAQGLDQFLADGRHGTMSWLVDHAERRKDPRTLWPDVRSIIVLAMNYGPDNDPMLTIGNHSHAAISVYAQNRDYHDVIKGKLKTLAGQFAARFNAQVKVFVDTAPVMEKPLAMSAGLGWQGKHTNLVSREFGSWLFLGSIFTDIDLAPDLPHTDHCGACTSCIAACPTKAITAPYRIDARRCISYLTIEYRGMIPLEFRKQMANRIYGCDDCLAVCPWNKFASRASEAKFHARDDLAAPQLAALLSLDDAAFRARFSGSPIKRIGRNRFIRNCLIAAGNADSAEMIAPCKANLNDPDPVIRASAVWALSQQLSPQQFSELRSRHRPSETDQLVAIEWSR